jgi:hypothetical protein
MTRLIFPLFFLLAGCASLDDVVGGIANTPEWFQERRVEIRGEGYPDLLDVPDEADVLDIGARLRSTENVTRNELSAFLADPRNEPATVTQEEISQTSANFRDQLPSNPVTSEELLGEAEIKALREWLRVPPVKKRK